jgi:hypothetical protein
MREHVDGMYFINAFKNKISCSSLSWFCQYTTPVTVITDYSTFMLKHKFKVSLSAWRISAVIAICKDTDILCQNSARNGNLEVPEYFLKIETRISRQKKGKS